MLTHDLVRATLAPHCHCWELRTACFLWFSPLLLPSFRFFCYFPLILILLHYFPSSHPHYFFPLLSWFFFPPFSFLNLPFYILSSRILHCAFPPLLTRPPSISSLILRSPLPILTLGLQRVLLYCVMGCSVILWNDACEILRSHLMHMVILCDLCCVLKICQRKKMYLCFIGI